MNDFIPMPKIPTEFSIIEKEEYEKLEIKVIELENKIRDLNDRILELEHTVTDFHREFKSHEDYYDHRTLNYED